MLADMTSAITKEDLREVVTAVKEDLRQVATDLGDRIDAVRDELGGRIDAVRDDLGKRLDAHDARFDSMDARFDSIDAAVHKNGVLIEQLESKVQAGSEWTATVQAQSQRAMLEMEERLGKRIAALEDVVGHHSRQVNGLTTEVAGLRTEVAELRRRFDRRDDLDALDRRVTKLEERFGR
jgi:chromosome segregation ATPase